MYWEAFLFHMPTETSKSYYLSNESVSLFTKGSDRAEVTVDLRRMIDGQPAVAGTESFPHMVYLFHIDPA